MKFNLAKLHNGLVWHDTLPLTGLSRVNVVRWRLDSADGCTGSLSAPRPTQEPSLGSVARLSVTHEPTGYTFAPSTPQFISRARLTGSRRAGLNGGRLAEDLTLIMALSCLFSRGASLPKHDEERQVTGGSERP